MTDSRPALRIPRQVIIETTSRCQLRCRFCPHLSPDAPHSDMDAAFFRSIVDRATEEFPSAVLIPWMNGEPLLHPEYKSFVDHLILRGRPFYVTTNGMVYNEAVFERLTDPDSTCYQLIFSLDGFTEKTAIAARPGTDYGCVMETIGAVMKMRERKRSKISLAVKLCARGQDYSEVEEYVSYWLYRGVSYVCLGKRLGQTNDSPMRVDPCMYADARFMVIRSDGRLVRCAYNDAAVNEPSFGMGFVDAETPLIETYNNTAMRAFRTQQRASVFEGPCRLCGFAYTGEGFEGTLNFRDKNLGSKTIFYHQDYYNEFFSFERSRRGSSWRGDTYRCAHCRSLVEAKDEKCSACGYPIYL